MQRAILIRVLVFVLFYVFLELLALATLTITSKTVGDIYRPNPSELNKNQDNILEAFITGPDGSTARALQDPILGWKPFGENNSAGMRDNREYPVNRDRNILRISAFGDSFTFGSDVPLEDSWGQQLMALNSSIQLFNFGAGAYGLDQAYLRYKRHKLPFRGDMVFIGYMSENIQRHVSVWRPFISPAHRDFIFTKPRYKIIDGNLVLLPNPIASIDEHRRFRERDTLVIPEIGKDDYHYQQGYNRGPLDYSPLVRLSKSFVGLVRKRLLNPIFEYNGTYSTRSEAFEVTKRIFDEFYREVLAEGSLPIILIFPEPADEERSREGRGKRYQPLLDYFEQVGYKYVDLQEAIKPVESKYSIADLRVDWGHFSPLGNKIIAEYLARYLIDRFSLDPTNVSPAVQAEKTRLRIGNAKITPE